MQMTSPLTDRTPNGKSILDSNLVLVVIIIIGAVIRFENVLYSFCLDDWDALKESLQVFPSELHKFRPIFFIILHYWRGIGPDAAWWIKMVPFLTSLAAVVLAWFVGKRFGGKPVAAALSFLMAISPLHLDMTNELRMYGLLSALGLAQVLCYLRYRETGKTGMLVWSTVIGTIAMYTQPMFAFFLFGLLIFAFLDRHSIKFWHFFAALCGVAVLYGPWVIVTLAYGAKSLSSSHQYTTHPLTAPFKLIAAYTTGFAYFKVGDLGLGAKFGMQQIKQNLPLVILAVLAYVPILLGAIMQLKKKEESYSRNAILLLAGIPFLIAYLGVLITNKNITHAQFHIASLPFVLLFLIKGIQGLGRIRIVQWGAAGLLLIVMSLSLNNYLLGTQHYGRRSNWFTAVDVIERQTSSEAPLMLLSYDDLVEDEYPYLIRYTPETRPYWLRVKAPMGQISVEEYTAYLQELLEPYREVSYLWWTTRKNILDPRNTMLESMRVLGKDETVEKISPRLLIYHWELPERVIDISVTSDTEETNSTE